MTMVNMWTGGMAYDVDGEGFDPAVSKITRGGVDVSQDVSVCTSLLSALLCSNTTLSKVKDPECGEGKWEPKGNSSEAPLLVAAREVGFSEDTRSKYPRALEIPFSPSLKTMLTVTDMSGRSELCDGGMRFQVDTKYLTVVKGAPNFIVGFCSQQLTQDGRYEGLDEAGKAQV